MLDFEDATFDTFIGHRALHGIRYIYRLAPIDMLYRCDIMLSTSGTPGKFHYLKARKGAHRGVVRVALSRCRWADGALVEGSLWERVLRTVRRHYLLNLVAHLNLLSLFLFNRRDFVNWAVRCLQNVVIVAEFVIRWANAATVSGYRSINQTFTHDEVVATGKTDFVVKLGIA